MLNTDIFDDHVLEDKTCQTVVIAQVLFDSDKNLALRSGGVYGYR